MTFIASGAATGGVGATTSFLDFPDEAKCRTAADVLAGPNQVTLGQGTTRPISLHRRPTASSLTASSADLIERFCTKQELSLAVVFARIGA